MKCYWNKSKWMWCKKLGHSLGDCPQDPNFRTNFSIFDEFFRVEGLKDIVTKRTSMDVLNKTEKLFKEMIPIKDSSPFKRGVMLFDDYNYQYFNKVVLPPLEELIDEEEGNSEDSDNASKSFHGSEDEEQDDEAHGRKNIEQPDEDNKELKKKATENDDFTIDEIKEIYYTQQCDPFSDIESMRNSTKLDNLSVNDLFSIKDFLKEYLPEQKPIGKALTIASSSRKDEETEIALITKGPKFITQENKEEIESIDSNKHFDENNYESTHQVLKVEGNTSYANLIKKSGKEGEVFDSDEDFEDTNRQFKSIDGRKKSGSDDFFKVSAGFTKGAFKNSLYSYREMKGSTEVKTHETIRSQTNTSFKKQKRLLGSEMDEMIQNEINKDKEQQKQEKIIRKNTKKFKEETKDPNKDSKIRQLLD